MTKRLRYDTAHMDAAIAYSKLSFARRQKVGALLVASEDRPLCSGCNGRSPGLPNECEDEVTCSVCEGLGYIKENGEYCFKCSGTGTMLVTKPDVHHAERNLLGFANKYGIATNNCTVYVTLSPCLECAKQMEIAGIVRVVYLKEYRDTAGIEYLRSRGISCEQIQQCN